MIPKKYAFIDERTVLKITSVAQKKLDCSDYSVSKKKGRKLSAGVADDFSKKIKNIQLKTEVRTVFFSIIWDIKALTIFSLARKVMGETSVLTEIIFVLILF